VRLHAPLLAEVADHFASAQVRNAATLGGNVCNASPAGDTLPALLALDAEAELARLGPTGAVARRRVPLDAFFAGPGRTRREPGELLVALRVPLAPTPRVTRFYKAGTRPALDISPVAIAFAARRDARGALQGVRLALGAVGPTPLRARRPRPCSRVRSWPARWRPRPPRWPATRPRPSTTCARAPGTARELLRNITRRMLTDVADH
jgi:CO/xanthine dehydrogenase FAD-binding subunit